MRLRAPRCYVDRFDEVVLCDGSLSLLRDARAALGNRAVFVAADVARLPFRPAAFDCVLTIRVLQHVHDLPGVFGEIHRVLAEDGRLLFSYHNKRNAKRVLRYFAARDKNPSLSSPAELTPTLISHHPTELEMLVYEAGFTPPDYQGTVVLDARGRITGASGRRTPVGARWAPFVGRFKLAPWLIGSSIAQGNRVLEKSDAIDDLFQCPVCGAGVSRSDAGFECTACYRHYPVEDGIVDFRP